jgi:hypothetical protein
MDGADIVRDQSVALRQSSRARPGVTGRRA